MLTKYLTILFIISPLFIFGQEGQKTLVFSNGIEVIQTLEADSSKAQDHIQDFHFDVIRQGYLTAFLKSSTEKNDTLTVVFELGKEYRFARLNKGNVDEGILSRINFREKVYRDKTFKSDEVSKLMNKAIIWCENNGYPFASIQLDSIEIKEESIRASLNLEKGDFVEIDSLIIKGESETSETFLRNYLGLKKGAAYDEKVIKKIDTRLRELPFIRLREGSKVLFTPGKADIYLFIDDQNSSNINGIAGLLPNEQTGEVEFTLDAKVRLRNALKRGELIDLNWRRLPSQSQDIFLQFMYPYLFKTPFGLDTDFSLFRRDSSFVEVNMALGIQYLFVGENYIKAFVRNYQSNLILPDLGEDVNSADVSLTSFGLEANYERLDYRFNPRRGVAIRARGAAGGKEVRNDVTESAEVSPQFIVDHNIRLFIPLFNRSAIMIRSMGSMIINDDIQFNELYRIGGIHSIRGFDEATLTASFFNIFTAEYRFILDQNSNFFVFYDWAYYENSARTDFLKDTPMGFGAGISFETGPGIFSVNYALGRQFDNPIDFRGAKLHFGFVNMF